MVVSIPIFTGLFYFFAQHNSKNAVAVPKTVHKPLISWQKVTIKEEEKNISISIDVPRVIIPGDYNLEVMINKTIAQNIELLKNGFIFSVSTAAENNGKINTLNISTEVLLVNPHLISLALTTTEHMAGIKDNDPERTFLIFDLINSTLVEENELFRDDLAWSKAVKAMKTLLLSNYQETTNCDLFFAPKHNGFSASCIGIDWNRGGERLSVMGDIPISMIQELLAPSILSDIVK